MFETMYNAHGIGLAAPQVGIAKRVFIVDTSIIEEKNIDPLKEVFINPSITKVSEDISSDEEGCLSIPFIRGNVPRPNSIIISYFDREYKQQHHSFLGFNARVIQHEYDHLEGRLFTHYLSNLKRSLLKNKLESIEKRTCENRLSYD